MIDRGDFVKETGGSFQGMEKSYVRSDDLMELEFITDRECDRHYHDDFEFLYVVSGKVKVSVGENENFTLNNGDMMMINPNRYHSYHGSDNTLIGRFVISYYKTRSLLNLDSVVFSCNSSVDQNEAYQQLRVLINRIFTQYISKKKEQVCLMSLYYQMLHILVNNFLLTPRELFYESQDGQSDDRLADIFSYIRANYKDNIRLQDLAEYLYLSPTYVSKYIKKKCGINFVELVNSVRLKYAMEELIHTDTSILKIAMDNGFASIAAFNRYFKDMQNMTPSEFRKKIQNPGREQERRQREEKIQEKVQSYLEKNPAERDDTLNTEKDIVADFQMIPDFEEKNPCLRMINVGTALDLTNSEYQEQIVSMKSHLGFEYVRFWDIYSPELYIDIHASREDINFRRLDTVFDFLVKNDLKPYVELHDKALRLLLNAQNAVKEVNRNQQFNSDEELYTFFDAFMEHLVRRYGSGVVRTWYFNYAQEEYTTFNNDRLEFSFEKGTAEKFEKYFSQFDLIAEACKNHLSDVHLGGGGFPVRHYERNVFVMLMERWKKHIYMPEFITITAFPYDLEKGSTGYYEKKTTDVNFVLHNLQLTRQLLEKADFPTKSIHVTEYNVTLSSRTAINDSCYKAAFLMQNAISCMKEETLIAHWMYSDLYSDYWDTRDILFGGSGIVTRDGIPKPAFFAFEFMNDLYKDILLRDKNCVVTTNQRNSFRVACNNMKNLKFSYYATDENRVYIKDIPNLMENREYLTLHLSIDHVPNGVYLVKSRQINADYGSIQNEWQDLNVKSHLNVDELDYLNKITMPKLTFQETIVEKNRLKIDILLQPNEIQYLYITKE